MKQLEQFIKKNIAKARRQITAALFVEYVMFGLLVGMIAGTVIMMISMFVPMYYAGGLATICIGLGVLTGFIITLAKRPNMLKASLMLDAKGFRERVTTAYLATGKDDTFSMMVKEDAKAHLVGYSISKAFPIALKKKQMSLLLVMAVVFFAAMQIETPAKQVAREQQAVVEAAKEKIRKVEKTLDKLEELEKNQVLSKDDLDKMKSDLDTAKKELKEAESKEDLEKATQRAEKKLEQNIKNMASENNVEAMKPLLDLALEMNDSLTEEEKKELTEKMKTLSELKEELAELSEKVEKEGIESLTEEELAALAESLKKAAAELDLEELQALAEKLGNGNAISAEDLAEALAAISSASGEALAEAMDGDASVSLGMGGEGSGTGDGNSSGSGGEEGGNGTGTGSGGGGQGGTGWNTGGEESYEKDQTFEGDYVTVPDNYQDDPNLKGNSVDGEHYIQDGGPAITWDGERKDYRDVIDEYEDQAFEKIDGGDYPEEMQEFIRDYFEYLNQ